ncbi:MAG TPA: hypothetical protein VLE49_10520, partial [Anaerolineales bacterium]|nr:hypothetical protein [Anaerolineales bacterium]
MPRAAIRVLFIVVLTFLVIAVSVVFSGYYELREASVSDAYAQTAQHYRNAAQRIPWRADLYELSGHTYYNAKDYIQADALYQKAFSRRALSPDGWVAWGDVNYLNDDPQRATEIWEQALEQKDRSDRIYSRLARIYQSNGE